MMKWKKEANDKWQLWQNGVVISTVYQTWKGEEIVFTEKETGRTSSDLENLQQIIEDGFNRIAQ